MGKTTGRWNSIFRVGCRPHAPVGERSLNEQMDRESYIPAVSSSITSHGRSKAGPVGVPFGLWSVEPPSDPQRNKKKCENYAILCDIKRKLSEIISIYGRDLEKYLSLKKLSSTFSHYLNLNIQTSLWSI